MSNALAPIQSSVKAAYTEVILDGLQARAWVDTRNAFQWHCKGLTYLFFKMLNPRGSQTVAFFTRDIPIAATDDFELFLNPDTFLTRPIGERIFIVGHEVLHNVFKHCSIMHGYHRRGEISYQDGKVLPFIWDIGNIAADYIINDLLVQSNVGQMPADALHRTDITCKDSFIDAYRKVFEEAKQNAKQGGKVTIVVPPKPGGQKGKGQGDGEGTELAPKTGGKKSFDEHLTPGAGQDMKPEDGVDARERQDSSWRIAIVASKSMGKMPGAMERLFNELTEPQVSWVDQVRGIVARRVGTETSNWRRPNKRMIVRDIYVPSKSSHGVGDIALVFDTSGSIGQTELDAFGSETRGIFDELKPRRVFIIWCDSKVHKVDVITDFADMLLLKPHGGGGTDFRPPFVWLEENDVEPEALIYLTDLEGPFPSDAPRYPVIWARTTNKEAPWGDSVFVPIKKG
jgi:predicted metal-dependent peptidase